MLQKRQIVPVQFVLTSINVAASGPEKTKKKSRNTHSSAEAEKRGIIIPFPNMEKSWAEDKQATYKYQIWHTDKKY